MSKGGFMEIITMEWLQNHKAGFIDIKFAKEKELIGLPADKFIEKLIEIEQFNWAHGIIEIVLSKELLIKYQDWRSTILDDWISGHRSIEDVSSIINSIKDTDIRANVRDVAQDVVFPACYTTLRMRCSSKIVDYGLKLLKEE